MSLYIEVILPIPVRSNFTYLVPENLENRIQPGIRVVAPLGKNKLYTGLISRILDEAPVVDEGVHFRQIDSILDETPVITTQQLELMRWISFYYCCTEGEVLNASLPAGLKPESALCVLPGTESVDEPGLSSLEFRFFEILQMERTLTIQQCREILGLRNPMPRLKKWQGLDWIRFHNQWEDSYKPKTRTIVELGEGFREDDKITDALDELTQHPKREAVFMHVLSAHLKNLAITPVELKKITGVSDSVINTLVKAGYLTFRKEPVDRTRNLVFTERGSDEVLTQDQEEALKQIKHSWKETPHKPVLLHGITGSGKTRVYQELIRDALMAEKQVLYILPEIALTRQVIDRMKTEFGDKVGVYHSRFNEQERVEIWNKILEGTFQLIIGVRSSILLPFQDLGLIILDEEQDSSLRQHERAPFYHTRNVALWYGTHFSVPVLLGSATPSLETFYQTEKNKYTCVTMLRRAQEAIPPKIIIVDMRLQEKYALSTGIFSDILIQGLEECLKKGEQAILLQNRRGYAPVLLCKDCGHITQCANCDISLTYHKNSGELRCHYCGYSHELLHRCEVCGSMQVQLQGSGTERVAEELQEIFPDARIQRMDLDTTRRKHASDTIIGQMEKGKIDFLVGTQMVSKGLDFESVSLVAVVQVDKMLAYPDFRASEHAYQLIMQVAGRAGRRKLQGKVIIQTRKPEHPVLGLLNQNYKDFYAWEKEGREHAHYPPFSRLIRMELKHANQTLLLQSAIVLQGLLIQGFPNAVLGPEPPLIARIRNEHRLQFLIKIHLAADPALVRKRLFENIETFYKQESGKGIRVKIEVDP